MSLHDVQFGDLCISTRIVNEFIRETLSMLYKTLNLQQNLNDSMRKTKAFIRWLNKCIVMVSSSNAPNDPNATISSGDTGGNSDSSGSYVLTNQDLNLIMNFLRENSLTNGFKFENIAYFLRKTKRKGTGGGLSSQADGSVNDAPGTSTSTGSTTKSKKNRRTRTAPFIAG